jgi:hypothetical protein
LDYLNGQELSILGDGATRAPAVVVNGKICFETHAVQIQVGLPYRARVETLDYEGGSAVGSSDFQKSRIFEADVHFYETLGGRYSMGHGPDTKPITYRTIEVAMDESAPLFSGHKALKANYAKSVLADARTENLRTQKATEGLIADQTGAIAKSGVQMSGSPMELLADTASEGNLAQQFNSYYANLSAENFKSESNLSKRAGRDARKASYLEAGGSLLAGALPMLY